jgi:predicted ATPase
LAWTLLFLGYPEQATARSREACALARDLSHPSTLALSLFFESALAQFRRDQPTEVGRTAETLVAFAGEQHLPFWSAAGRVLQGWALTEEETGREEGIAHIRHALADYQATGGALYRPYFLALLAEVCAKAGQVEEASSLLADALAGAERVGERWYQAELHRREGELLARSDADRAEVCFRRALILAERQGARVWQLRAATSLARLWWRQGRRLEAHELLAPVYGWFTEGFDALDLIKAKRLLLSHEYA